MEEKADRSIDEGELAGEARVHEAAETGQSDDGSLNATGVYEASGGVVLYDSEQPLAWVQADNAVPLTEMV